MDQLGNRDPFASFIATLLKEEEGFVLIDVGAASGIAPAWRSFGSKLRGFGFDPDPEEVGRLNAVEPAPAFRYISGSIGIPPAHRFAQERRNQPRLSRNPWRRLAVERWLSIRRLKERGLPKPAATRVEDMPDVGEQAHEPSSATIDLGPFLESEGLRFVDFLKIDVDGTDFDILQSLDAWYDKLTIIGIGIEVNFFGGNSVTENTFHNVDRFLKGHRFELFDLSIRRYAMQDLPSASRVGLPYPADTLIGRPFQGDAFYARDICSLGQRELADGLRAERLAKAAALYSIFGLPDCAAEVLITFRERLEPMLDVDQALDLLAKQAQPGVAAPLSYRDYIAAFEKRAYDL